VAIFYQELRTELVTLFVFKITPLHGPHGKHRRPLLWLQDYSCVAWQHTSYSAMLLLGSDRIENGFPSIVACIRVYRAVAWQRIGQIHYIAPSLRLFVPNSLTVHHLSFLSRGCAFNVFLQIVISFFVVFIL
jgi:hypothetical protein